MTLNLILLDELIELSNDGGEDLITNLYLDFKRSAPILIAEIRQGYLQDDKAMVEAAAHKLKSTSGSFGLAVISDLSYSIMEKSRGSQIEAVKADLEDLLSIYEDQMAELQAYLLEKKVLTKTS